MTEGTIVFFQGTFDCKKYYENRKQNETINHGDRLGAGLVLNNKNAHWINLD